MSVRAPRLPPLDLERFAIVDVASARAWWLAIQRQGHARRSDFTELRRYLDDPATLAAIAAFEPGAIARRERIVQERRAARKGTRRMDPDLRTEFDQAAEAIEAEHEAPRRQAVRAIQEALAPELAEARTVPARLRQLDPVYRPLALEAIDLLADERFERARPELRKNINQTLALARQIRDLLDNGGARAERRVQRVESFTYEQIRSWSKPEFIRCEREALLRVAEAPHTVETGAPALKEGLEEIRQQFKTQPGLAEPTNGHGALMPPDQPRQGVAAHGEGILGKSDD